MKGDYDGNITRVINKEVSGVSVLTPGGKDRAVVDILCCNIM